MKKTLIDCGTMDTSILYLVCGALLLIILTLGFGYVCTGDIPHIPTQEDFNAAMVEFEEQQESTRQCIDICVQQGGIYETCRQRCI